MLDLLRPIYKQTAAYGHFGRDELEFSWEKTDKAAALRAAAGCRPRARAPAIGLAARLTSRSDVKARRPGRSHKAARAAVQSTATNPRSGPAALRRPSVQTPRSRGS